MLTTTDFDPDSVRSCRPYKEISTAIRICLRLRSPGRLMNFESPASLMYAIPFFSGANPKNRQFFAMFLITHAWKQTVTLLSMSESKILSLLLRLLFFVRRWEYRWRKSM